VAAEIAGGAQHLRGERARLAGRLARPGDVGRDVGGADGRLLDVAGDLLRRRALLLDDGGDGRRDLDDLADRSADLADGGDAIAGGASPGPSIACRRPRRTTRRNSGATSFLVLHHRYEMRASSADEASSDRHHRSLVERIREMGRQHAQPAEDQQADEAGIEKEQVMLLKNLVEERSDFFAEHADDRKMQDVDAELDTPEITRDPHRADRRDRFAIGQHGDEE